MGRERLATFGFGDLVGEGHTERDAADEHVAECFTARFGITDRGEGRGCRVVLEFRDHVHHGHRFLTAARGGYGNLTVRVLLPVPLRKGFVVAALARVQHTGSRRCVG